MYRKMVIGFGLILAAMIAVNGTILFSLDEVAGTVRTILSSDVGAVNAATRTHALLEDEQRNAQKFLVSHDSTYLSLFTETASHTAEQLDSLAATTEPPSATLVNRARQRHHSLVLSVSDTSLPPDAAEVFGAYQILHNDLDAVIASRRASINSSLSELDSEARRLITVAIVLTCCALLGIGAVALIITHSIAGPLNSLREGTRRVAEGDFRPIRISSSDEIAGLAGAFNVMSARLKRSNDQRAEMMRHISHEIRMPLQAMHSALYLLAQGFRGPLTDAQQKLLDTLRTNINRIADFSNQFLDLAKIEAGMMEFHFAEVNLADVVAAAVEAAQPAAAAREISLRVEAAEVPTLSADRDRVYTVVSNFLSNAVKFTERGGTVTVELAPCQAGVRLSVRDTGLGIHPDDLPNVFAKFFQARNAASAGQRGTGLGLALVKAIVEEHRGRVYARSVLGEGSVFTAEFPAPGTRSGKPRRNHAVAV